MNPYDEYIESFYLLERESADAILSCCGVTETAAEHLKTLESTLAAYAAAERGFAIPVSEFSASVP